MGSKQRYLPPLNFAMVEPGVYRSGHPNAMNFGFLKKLELKSVVYLANDDLPDENKSFMAAEGIRFWHFKIEGNKEPFVELQENEIAAALAVLLDTRNHPVLLHCLRGKHRIGCLVGCLRRLQHWSLASIFDEYRRFAGTKIRIADQEFIELFSTSIQVDARFIPSWI
ncbi:protein-tyrosine phosphatase [Gonapodya prolifera JEL478]|uniref:diphosphoinositol-polyphosphate diphosphatase n=1 Tax=Gonapodya prolifera (strain JEL478) TaxID=1344416 RepID=A0A139AB25_GONPJ|nr:protein-tyrosine phosphatase [Gonapodya prolifera JEL478]|eukprot:KXS13908.1 protein-tyrosine phosphatase [Gonapodya prolifera JEL478]